MQKRKEKGSTSTFVSKPPQIEKVYTYILIIATFLIYLNSIPNNYNLDDELVTRNHKLTSQGMKALPAIFSSPYFADNMGNAYEYRPVTLMSFAIEHQFFGENPQISHFFNVLLYTLTILILFKLLKKLFNSENVFLAFAVSLLFATHPIHTEVVAGIKNRDEILALLFGLLSLKTAISYIEKFNIKLLVISLLLFTAGLLSKMSVLSFTLIIPLALITFKNTNHKQVILLSLFLALITAFFAPFHNFSYKVLFAVGLFLTNLTFFIFINSIHRKINIQSIFNFFLKNDPNAPVKRVYNLSHTITYFIISALLIISVIGVIYNQRPLFYLSIIATIFLYLSSTSRNKQLYFLLINFIVAFISINYKQPHSIAFCLIFTFFVFFFVEHKKWKPYIILSLIFLFVPWAINQGIEGFLWFIYMGFILWVYTHEKFRKLSFLLLFVFFISSPLVSFLRGISIFSSVHLYSFIVLSVGLFIHNRFKQLQYVLLLFSFIIPVALAVQMSGMTGSYSIIIEKYANPASIINVGTEYLPAGGRVLDMVEMPLRSDASLNIKIGTGAFVLAEYVKLLLFPYQLGFYYGYSFIEPVGIANFQSLFSLIFHISLFILSLILFKKHKFFSFGIIFYLISISVFANIITPLPGLMAERFMYIPSLGFSILLGTAIVYGLKSRRNQHLIKIQWAVLLTISMLFAVRAFSRNFDWKDHLTLFRADIQHLDKSAQANNLLATNLVIYAQEERNVEKAREMQLEAIKYYKKAILVYPDFINANYDLSRTYQKLNMTDSALIYFKRSTELRPDFFDPYLQIAFIYHQQDSIEEALPYYYKALERKNDIDNVYGNLSYIYFSENNADSVIAVNLRHLRLRPGNKNILINLTRASFMKKDYESAAHYSREILKITPNDIDAQKALEEANFMLSIKG
ncbi:MAG: glycosyltransferase family 39 protein [Bacteroidales bacterium]|nr:glycosyltransferase family 39 protein [Bacteroidales bacterium]